MSKGTILAALLFATGCRDTAASILLFEGSGTSSNDVAAVEHVLRNAHLAYATANSRQLGAMSESTLRAFRLLIVPGGNFVQIGTALSPAAAAHVRNAVHGGLNYLGICAGAFFAGDSPYNGLNLTSGVRFPFYAAEARGLRKSVVEVVVAGSSPVELYWEDGPQLAGWGGVVARYPDGTPAVTQGRFGDGWVTLLGVHPEAPDGWRRGLSFRTSGDAGRAYAATLINAALSGAPLQHY